MTQLHSKALIIVCFLSIGFTNSNASEPLAAAGSKKPCIDNFLFQLDNDMLTGADRDYTSGWRLAFGGQFGDFSEYSPINKELRKFSGDKSSGSYPLFNMLSKFNDPDYRWGFALAQFLYTPDNDTAPAPPQGERPYAAWLGVEYSLHVRDEDSLSSVAVSIGVTGEWALGEETQDFVHEHISGSPFFQGWDTQLPEEVTINLHWNQKRRLGFLDDFKAGRWSVDGYYEYGASAGTYRTAAYMGGLVRAGLNLPNDYSAPRLEIASYSNQSFKKEPSCSGCGSIYLLGGIRGSAVLHDITLDGSLFQNWSHSVNSEPLVGEVIAGVGARICKIELLVARTFRSNEFRGQSANQTFDSAQIRWVSEF